MDDLKTATSVGLQKYFEEGKDVRIQLRELFAHAKAVVAREREINLEVVLLIGALERQNAAVNLMMWGGKRELAQALGLTLDQYLKRAQAGRVLWRYPEFIEALEDLLERRDPVRKAERAVKRVGRKGEILRFALDDRGPALDDDGSAQGRCHAAPHESVAYPLHSVHAAPHASEGSDRQLAHAAPHASEESGRQLTHAAPHASEGSGRWFSHAVPHESGEYHRRLVHAAPHAFSHVKHPDYAERPCHAERSEASRSIPAAVKHAVTLRDKSSCSYLLKDGSRCVSRIGIQYDHIVPIAHSGNNEVGNIRLLCRDHNIIAAKRMLGVEVMSQM